MQQEIAYRNGQFVSASELMVPPQDMGFLLGVTVAEQLRTFRGELFAWPLHAARLQNSLDLVGIDEISAKDLLAATQHVAAHNYALLEPGADLGVTVFVTPGPYPIYAPDQDVEPTVGIHSYPLPFQMWANKYEDGQACVVVSVPQVSEQCWPRALKCRSRMHYYLADREARQSDPSSRAILLDQHGNVNEASTANVIAYFKNEGIVSPPIGSILPGISLKTVERFAIDLDCRFTYRSLSVDELMLADEILLTSTPFCVLPVCKLGDRQLVQRDCFHWLIRAWNTHVGFDIPGQAKRMTG